MKNTALKVLLTAAVLIPVAVYAQPRPGNPTTATVITKEEIAKISATEQSQRTRDENAKVVDIGDGWSMELGIIHRSSTRTFRRAAPIPPTQQRRPSARRAVSKWQIRRRMQFGAPLRMIIRPKAITSSLAAARRSLTATLVNGRHGTANPDGGPNGPGCGGLAVGVTQNRVEGR